MTLPLKSQQAFKANRDILLATYKRDVLWKEKHYAYNINVPRAECNFRGEKNRVSLVTTNQLLCAFPNKNVTDVLLFPFAEVQILVNADFERVWD